MAVFTIAMVLPRHLPRGAAARPRPGSRGRRGAAASASWCRRGRCAAGRCRADRSPARAAEVRCPRGRARRQHRLHHHLARRLPARRLGRAARARGAPLAAGQHVRVRRDGPMFTVLAYSIWSHPARPALARAVRHRPGAAHPRAGRRGLVHRGRRADAVAEELLAGHPRHRRDPRHRGLHHRVRAEGGLPRSRTPSSGPGGPASLDRFPETPAHRAHRLQAAHRRLPAVDVHPHRRRDLGAAGLGVLLELGPQGGLDLRHLGRLRGVPARAGDQRDQPRRPRPTSRWRATPASSSTSPSSTCSSSASTPTRGSR